MGPMIGMAAMEADAMAAPVARAAIPPAMAAARRRGAMH